MQRDLAAISAQGSEVESKRTGQLLAYLDVLVCSLKGLGGAGGAPLGTDTESSMRAALQRSLSGSGGRHLTNALLCHFLMDSFFFFF